VSSDSENNILGSLMFGEPLLIIGNQVNTKFKKSGYSGDRSLRDTCDY